MFPQDLLTANFRYKKSAFSLAILSIAFIFLFVNTSFSQEAAKDQLFSFDDWSGGLNTKQSPLSLKKNQFTIAENVRFNTELGSASKRDEILLYGSADATEPITGMHRLYLRNGTKALLVTHGDEIEKGNDDTGVFTNILNLSSGNYHWQWITWNNVAIGTDGYNQPVKYDGSSASATYLGSCLALDSGTDDADGPNGTYTYKVIFYTTSYTVALNVPSNSITVSTNKINLSMIPIGPDTYGGENIIGRKIYRTGNGDSTYVLLSNGTIADNSTMTLVDSDTDAQRSGAYPTPNATYTPPKGKFLLVNNNRLFIADDPVNSPSRIYYSEDGSMDYFIDDTNYFDIRPDDGDDITFAKNLLGILTIGKNNTIQKLYTDGTTPSADWEISDPFSFIGCQAPYSAVNSPLGIIYLAFDGIYKFNGQYSTLISDPITPEIFDISPSNYGNAWGEFHQNIYYLAYTSEKTGASVNDKVLIFDLLSNAYSIDLLSLNAFCAFNSGSDWGVLYSGSSTNGKVYAHSQTVHEVIHKTQSDFAGTWDTMRYIPTRWGGDINSPVLEIAWTQSIDTLTGIVNNMAGDVNRPGTSGTYFSQVLQLGASSFDKLYWNESIPASGGDVSLAIRTGATATACTLAAFSSSFNDPTGSDISGVTPNDFLQYKIAMTTSNIDYTPNVYNANNYVVKLTYNLEGVSTESSIPFHLKSGWVDMGASAFEKSLRSIYCWYESEGTGTLTLKFENDVGDSDTFSIDLKEHPSYYEERFTGGSLKGKLFDLDIIENSLKDLRIKRIVVKYDVEPII